MFPWRQSSGDGLRLFILVRVKYGGGGFRRRNERNIIKRRRYDFNVNVCGRSYRKRSALYRVFDNRKQNGKYGISGKNKRNAAL